MKTRALTLLWILPLLALGAGCGEDRIESQHPRLGTDLAPDPSGEVDFLVDFGEVPLGRRESLSFQLENLGNADLNAHSLGAEAPFGFLLSRGRTPVGASSELRFTFAPKEETPEPLRRIVSFSTNEGKGGRSYSIRLVGRGIVPKLRCEPPLLDFGVLALGTSASLTTSCTNPLTVPLEVSALPIEGSNAAGFSAAVPGQGGRALVQGGGSVEIELRLQAQRIGENRATLVLQDAHLNPVAHLELLAEVVPTGLRFEPSTCLDFPYVQLGETLIRSFSIENVGPDPVQIDAIEPSEPGDFSVVTPLPLSLPGGTAAAIELSFHPTAEGLRQAMIEVRTGSDLLIGGPYSTCAKGFGGGPRLSCTPDFRDLGTAAAGVPVIATFDCLNAGNQGGGRSEPLFVRTVSSDDPSFTASVLNKDGSHFPEPAGYPAGETFKIEARFDPTTEGFHAANIRVETSANQVELRVAGEGRVLPPCDFSIEPRALRFGVVSPGEDVVQSFRIHNHADTACLIRDLRLGAESDPAYSLEPIAGIELEGLSSLEIPVRFAPTTIRASSTGKVLFDISNAARRRQEVELSATSMSRCLLLEPASIEFGARTPSCQPLTRRFDLINACGTTLTIRSASTTDPAVFALEQQLEGAVLLPNRRLPVELSFQPAQQRPYLGSLDLEVEVEKHTLSPMQLYRIPMTGRGSDEAQQSDEFVVKGKPKVDILWVIDNSGSMSRYQDRIANNLPSFIDYTEDKDIDYQIGVTTTAVVWGAYGAWCPGGVEGEENGRLFPADGSHPRILTPATPDLETHWKHNIQVGTCFALNQESAMEAAYRALSPPLINSRKDPRYDTPYQDGNLGFLRPDAALSIILVSDAIDYSSASHEWYLDFFRGLKNWDPDRLRIHTITGPRAGGEVGECKAGPGDRMLELTRATGGVWMDICTPTEDRGAWSLGLSTMSEGAFSIAFTDRFTLRGRPADRTGDGKMNGDDIEVWVNGQQMPSSRPGTGARAWVYEPINNQIRFEPLYAPKVGAQITATYDISCR